MMKDGETVSKKEVNNTLLSEIEKNIPELFVELNKDENFKK